MDLLQKLTEEGFIDNEQVSFVLDKVREKGQKKEEVLLENEIIEEEKLFSIKAELFGIPLKKYNEVDVESVSAYTMKIFQGEFLDNYKVAVVGRTGETIDIGMVYPEDIKAKEAVNFIAKKEELLYNIYLITPSTFEKLKENASDVSKEITSPLLRKLLERELLKKEEAEEVLRTAEKEKKVIEEVILEKEMLSEDDLFEVKSEILTLPIRDNIDVENIPLDVLNIIHKDSAIHYKMVPLGKTEEKVDIGMVYPENERAQEALKFISRQDIFSYNIYLITLSSFNKIVTRYQEVKSEREDFLERLVEKKLIDENQANIVREQSERENVKKEEILVKESIVGENDLFRVKSEVLKTPYKEGVNTDDITEDVASIITQDTVEHYKVVPLKKEDKKIEIGMVYPEDERAQDAVKMLLEQRGVEYEVFLISISAFREGLAKIKSYNKEGESTLTEKLIIEGYLDRQKAQEIEEEKIARKTTREELLVKEKIIGEEDLFIIKSDVVGVPFRSVISSDGISEDLLRLIPEDSANYYKMAPIGKEGDVVEIGMVYPENLRAKEALKFLSRRDGFKYSIYLISISTFEDISKQYRTLSKEVGAALEDIEDMDIEEETTRGIDMDQDVGRLAEEAPIVKVVAVILRNAIEGGASDIHIEPTREKLKVRFRVDGTLYASLYLPINIHLAIVARIKILAGLKIDEQRLPQDGRFSTKMRSKNIDFRVSTFPTTLGEKVVIRVLDPEKGLRSIDDLGVMGRNFEILEQSIKRPTGMTLVTGPTGSGKTTTLYALLKILNNENVNIVTLEDPVEYFMDGVNQSQVHSEIGYVFAKGLRQILRQDPDIIMVGEIRDDETADLAVHAALTGHMVLSTIHTNNAIGVVPRLIDMGIKPFLIPAALNTAMSQRLVGRLCEKCKEQTTPTPEVEMMIKEEIDKIPLESRAGLDIPDPITIFSAPGCKYCSQEGVVGRMAICEVLKMTPELGEIIMGDLNERKLREEALRQGMITVKQDGMIKVMQGYTTIREVLRATEEK